MQIAYNEKYKYKLYTGKLYGDTLRYSKQIGYAQKYPEHEHYFIRLWMFPEQTYYLIKGETLGRDHWYRLFATCNEVEGVPHYFDQIGNAFLSRESKQFMEIKLNFPNQRVFMSLYPKESKSQYEFYEKVKPYQDKENSAA